jgi:hypothetical protein
MKLSNQTVPTLMLELIGGILLLLAVLLFSSGVNNRGFTLSPSISTPLFFSVNPVSPLAIGGQRALSLLAVLEKKIVALDRLQKKAVLSLDNRAPSALSPESEMALGQISPKLEVIKESMGRLLESQNEILASEVDRLDERVNTLLLERKKNFPPLVGELSKKTDLLLLEYNTTIHPALVVLREKVDLLLLEKEATPSLIPEFSPPSQGYEEEPPWVTRGYTATRIAIANGDLPPPQEAEHFSRSPLINSRGSGAGIPRYIQDILRQNGIDSTIDPAHNGLQLSPFFDFERGSSTLSQKQVEKITHLAGTLVEIFPCYAQSSDPAILNRCHNRRSPIGLDSVVIQGFSTGGIVGSRRFNYNWRLAYARSSAFLKAIVTARPDLMDFSNEEGRSLFKVSAKLIKAGDPQARRVEIKFIMSSSGKR